MAGASIATLAPAAQAATKLGDRTLRPGSVGSDVKQLQRSLAKVGLKAAIDGEYGSTTSKLVVRFQKWVGIQTSGIAGAHTFTALQQKVAAGETVPATTSSTTTATSTKKTGGASTFDVNPSAADALPAGKATISNGIATAPAGAPQEVLDIIAAGNKIAKTPYVWGGGHGSWNASGYDCSGSVSYALHGAGLLDSPLVSGDLEDYGKAGAGKWVTIYANAGHTYMYVAGIRFDTSGADPSRWQSDKRSNSGFVVRHPAGL